MLRRALLTGLVALLSTSAALGLAPTKAPELTLPKSPLRLRSPLKLQMTPVIRNFMVEVRILTVPATENLTGHLFRIYRNDTKVYTGYVDGLLNQVVYLGGFPGRYSADLVDPAGNVVAVSEAVYAIPASEEL